MKSEDNPAIHYNSYHDNADRDRLITFRYSVIWLIKLKIPGMRDLVLNSRSVKRTFYGAKVNILYREITIKLKYD